MKVKIKKKEETKQYNVINSWSDVTLEKWVQIIKVKDGLNSEQAKETIKALSDIPEKLIKELSIIDVAIILKNIYELQAKEDTELKRIIEIDDVEYGFHPKLDDITLGEYADLETFIKNGLENHLPEIMAILYRPVQEKKNNKYTIEAYDGDLTIRAEIMNKMSAEQVQNALVFFWTFVKEFLMILPSFLMEQAEKIAKMQHPATSQINGIGSV
jgi:hypothetical protein|tara:strand:- start:100 stop:741 length:642 start_codon:yes stop_codon:yes gene_type:complete